MKKHRLWKGIWISSLLIVFAGISPAMGENNKMGGTERPVVEALETPSFETERAVETGALLEPALEELSEDDLGIPEKRQLEDTYPDD